jgi:hypothetical protein
LSVVGRLVAHLPSLTLDWRCRVYLPISRAQVRDWLCVSHFFQGLKPHLLQKADIS